MIKHKNKQRILDGPLLDTLTIRWPAHTLFTQFPLCLPLIKSLETIHFPTKVTFFVGENGSGKSTILEAIAHKAGFGPEGGSKNIHFKTSEEITYVSTQLFADHLTLSWRLKPQHGYFFRAESFFNVANHIDHLARIGGEGEKTYSPYGGKSLHEQSHGESFLSFFTNTFGSDGFFIFDEPEAALSPQRQLSLLAIIHRLCTTTDSQFIIATHSPLLLAYPNATIYSCDGTTLKTIPYERTDHYQITKSFLNAPDYYLAHLFNNETPDAL